MNNTILQKRFLVIGFLMMLIAMVPGSARAVVDGLSGTIFNLTAKDGTISMGDGEVAYMWGFADGAGPMQYPGPTLILNQGAAVTVNFSNQLTVPASIVFPGQDVSAAAAPGSGQPGLLTLEARPGETVTYTFVASQPGTYTYYSGTRPELQVEMGLIGAIVIRPTLGANCTLPADPNNIRPSRGYAYCTPSAYFDREYLFLVSEIDPLVHRQVGFGNILQVDNTARRATAWFLNGRSFPDTMAMPSSPYLPNQPYDAMPLMHPGEKVLIRLIGGGRDLHPFHTHGQNHLVIARDGRLLKTAVSTIVDLSVSDFTTTTVPGETVDEIWGPWTGEKLGWDVYGHVGGEVYPAGCPGVPAGQPICGGYVPGNPATYFDPYNNEYCPDHGNPIPVKIPGPSLLSFGPMYGGTPYLGTSGELPPSHVQQNPQAGLSFMWHSHSERELTTNNIFIGGMATMGLVLPYHAIQNNTCTPVNIP